MKEERNDDQVLVRLPKSTKDQIEMVARIEGMTTQEWIREAMKSRLCLHPVANQRFAPLRPLLRSSPPPRTVLR
ncbi:MAG TPA: hypothetical protein O0X69_06280 [Methanocorpusculum sp.]|nr:hypothetical protein [Methanocorpusculum sp.]